MVKKKIKSIRVGQKVTVKQLNEHIKKLRKKGLKPFIKGKGNKSIKIEFE